ncbi:predicted protein [Nematostella vectensis]|uniref:Transcobalamin-like C-terminal domain-containing protein n=1 Tax=Nematostella vectensis TaxID=45351 RepID=A7RWL1_NEMVE|nr:uncharacterized protein CG3556 [Nematostella vectensis]EDO44185.1 predicted protein [Nematostella vectensis]|eukprot:XP_001636248.1 predicted protein [Nematostella vectensis]
MKHFATLAVILAVFSQSCDVDAFCGDRVLSGKLARASVRAGEWVQDNLRRNLVTTDGHVLASAAQALRLVGFSLNETADDIEARMQSEITTAGLKTIPMGRVAQYIHGVFSICADPRAFHEHNLVKELKLGTSRFPEQNFDHFFQYSTAVLALCVSGYTHASFLTRPLVNQMLTWSKSKKSYNADTVAVATMALSCMYGGRRSGSVKDRENHRRVRAVIKKATKWLAKQQRRDGSSGDGVTTALVSQALLSAESIAGSFKKWECAASLRYLVQQQQSDGSYGDLMSTIQIMPVLVGAIPADLRSLKCQEKSERSQELIQVCVQLQIPQSAINHLSSPPPPPLYLNFTSGTNAHKILRLAAQHDQRYAFTTRKSSYGHMITSIYGLEERPEKKMHWMLFATQDKMASTGIDGYRPQHGSCVIFKYMNV